DLLQRIHPAESRILKLSQTTPALYIVFDLLVDERRAALVEHELSDRRAELERFAKRHLHLAPGHDRGLNGASIASATRLAYSIRLSPMTRDFAQAQKWLRGGGATLDGVIAKRLDCDYRTG